MIPVLAELECGHTVRFDSKEMLEAELYDHSPTPRLFCAQTETWERVVSEPFEIVDEQLIDRARRVNASAILHNLSEHGLSDGSVHSGESS